MSRPLPHAQRPLVLAVVLVVASLAGCTDPADLPPGVPPTYLTQWGSYGSGNGQFKNPVNLAVGSAGDVYVADTGNDRIQRFTDTGGFVGKWGAAGSADGQMMEPSGVAVDAAGNVYVADTQNHRVQKFTASGAFLAKWGTYGTADGQFKSPIDLAVDPAGNVFVVDGGNGRIQKFTSTGTFLAKWGSAGNGYGDFAFVRGIDVDAAGNVYTADQTKPQYFIQKFSNTGTYLGFWGGGGNSGGQFQHPHDVAVDTTGNVYVTDGSQQRVRKFDPVGGYWTNNDGGFLAAWGTYGVGNGQFHDPTGIDVDAARNVYVADTANHRVQKFGILPDSILVKATLDGAPWSGPVAFTLTGTQTFAGTTAPQTAAPLAGGVYTLAYVSGGPPGATVLGTTPATPQILLPGATATFTLDFRTPINVVVKATLDGSPWSGPMGFTLSGAQTLVGTAVPHAANDVAAGAYTLAYATGGPAGATLFDVTTTPAVPPTTTGGTTTFVANFRSPGVVSDSITVTATLDGAPWSGAMSYDLQGIVSIFPFVGNAPLSGTVVPQTFANLPPGTGIVTDPVTGATGPGIGYGVQYLSGGPPGAAFTGIAPSLFQTLVAGGTKTFTFAFETVAPTTGTATVAATLDGAPWTGAVAYTLSGPQTVAGTAVAATHAGLQPGAYTLTYGSGGPAGATLLAVSPAGAPTMATGDTVAYTLQFRTAKPETGRLLVKATLDGAPWSGPLGYTLTGPQTVTGATVPQTTPGAAAGAYTLSFTSGGPTGASLVSVTPATTQTLAGGGSKTFTLAFETDPVETGTLVVQATLAGAGGTAPWTGPVDFTLSGPQSISGTSVDHTSTGVPVGSYVLTYVSGGPPGATFAGVTPSATQTLGAGATVTFTLRFT